MCAYVCVCVCVRARVCVYVRMCVCVCVCIHSDKQAFVSRPPRCSLLPQPYDAPTRTLSHNVNRQCDSDVLSALWHNSY